LKSKYSEAVQKSGKLVQPVQSVFYSSKNMSAEIREATRDDVVAITNLIRVAFTDVAQRFQLTPKNCPKHPSNCEPGWIETAMEKGVVFYLLEDGGTLVGCGALEQPEKPGTCYLERLAVLPQYRHQGLGKRLVEHIEAEAKTRNLQRVEIGIIAEQEDLSTWYGGMGFVVTGEKEFEHLPFRVAFMAKNLSESSERE
jgi:N-acetylglutamate synthase-like GNAT family acetyltransferase